MEQAIKKDILELKQTSGDQNGLRLELNITDPIVTKYLVAFDEPIRQDKAIEALRVGVIAIQSASPTLDTKVVEEEFRKVEKRIDAHISEFERDITEELEGYFKTGSGSVPRSLDNLFGDNGTLTVLMNQYFGGETGRVKKLLQDQVGPSSTFAKSLDPTNKESVISRLEETVKGHLKTETDKIVKQFSLDIPDSALSRLDVLIAERVKKIGESNGTFFNELKEALGIQTGKKIESERGTQKGREFEIDLYDRVAQVGQFLGDSTENVRSLVGVIERSKKGDYVMTLGEESAAPGHKVVIEAKKEQGYRLKDAISELKEAKENRQADAGIFVFAKGYEPPEVGDFLKVGSDFYVTVDESNLADSLPLLFLESAYKITRTLIVTSVRKEEEKAIDIDRIRREIDSIIQQISRLSELSSKAKTISSNSKFIEETANELKTGIENHLNEVLKLLV